MIYSAVSWCEAIYLINYGITYKKNSKEIKYVSIDKTPTCIVYLFNKHELAHYLCAESISYDYRCECLRNGRYIYHGIQLSLRVHRQIVF